MRDASRGGRGREGAAAARALLCMLLLAALAAAPAWADEPPPFLGPRAETVPVEHPGAPPDHPPRPGKVTIPLRLLWSAETVYQSGDPAVALSRFLDLAYNFADDERKGFVWMRVGELLLSRGDLKQALEAANKAIGLTHARFLALSAMDLKFRIDQRLGRRSEARQIAEYLLDQGFLGADPSELLGEMARADGQAGKIALALSEYRRAIAAAPGPVQALRLRVDRNALIDGQGNLFTLWEAAETEGDADVRTRLYLQLGQTAVRKGFFGMGAFALSEASRGTGARAEEAVRQRSRVETILLSHPRIVGLVPLSGKYADVGFALLAGAEVALHRSRVPQTDSLFPVLQWVDTKGDPSTAQAWYLTASRDRSVIGFIGPLTGEEGYSVSVAFTPESPPVLYLGQKSIPARPFLYRFGLSPGQEARAVLSHLAKTGRTDLILLYPANGYGRGFADAVASAAAETGVRVARSVSYPPGTNDFTDVIRRAVGSRAFSSRPSGSEKGEAMKLSQDAIVIADRWERVFLLASQLRYYDVYVPLAGFSGWNDEELLRKAGNALDNSVFSVDYARSVPGYLGEDFRKEYRDALERTPSRFGAVGYDAALFLADSFRIKAADGYLPAGARAREGITLLKTFRGVTGTFRFEPDGQMRREVTLLRVEAGSFVPVPDL